MNFSRHRRMTIFYPFSPHSEWWEDLNRIVDDDVCNWFAFKADSEFDRLVAEECLIDLGYSDKERLMMMRLYSSWIAQELTNVFGVKFA